MVDDEDQTSRTLSDAEWSISPDGVTEPVEPTDTVSPTETHTSTSIGQTSDLAAPALEERIRAQMRQKARIRKDPLIGRVFDNRFELTSKVGTGGMGVVYKARQKGMDRHVAIKVLLKEYLMNETAVRRFQREALAVSKLEHPNTVRIYDFGETEDKILYIAMEFLPGDPLSRILSQQRQLSVRQTLRIVTQICRSLDEAHRKGIIHRDLKPDNVFVGTIEGQRDYVKVLDFGVAKLRESDDSATLTQHGVLFGTPKYMSPEQCRSQAVDARSDLYAVGVMMYEMLAGRVPFEADNSMAILVSHAQDAPAALNTVRADLVVPFEVEELLHTLLAKDPESRPQSAKRVIQQCEQLLHSVPDDFECVVVYDSDIAQALQIDRSQAYTVPEDALSRTEMNRLVESERQIQSTIAIDAPRLPMSKARKFFLWSSTVVLLLSAVSVWAFSQISPVPSEARQMVPNTLIGNDLPTAPDELVTIAMSANVDNVTVVNLATEQVLGTLPKGDVVREFRWLKESNRRVDVELRHGSAAPIRRTIDLSKDGVIDRAEFVRAQAGNGVRQTANSDEGTVVSRKAIPISLRFNVGQVDVVLPTGLKYESPKLKSQALVLQLEESDSPVRLKLSKRGYVDRFIDVVADKAKAVDATLKRRPRFGKPTTPSAGKPTKNTPTENPRLSPIKKPNPVNPGRLGRLKGVR